MKKLTKKKKTTITALRLDRDDWWLIIHSVEDGYVLETNEGDLFAIGSTKDEMEMTENENLLWEIIDYFDMRPSRYERERLAVIREIGDKYIPQKDEKIVKKYYEAVEKK